MVDFSSITIICDKLTFLGGSDLAIMGSPKDVNEDSELRNVIKQLKSSYIELASRLAASQFPRECALPDGGNHAIFKLCSVT
jgi:hypothetical protein